VPSGAAPVCESAVRLWRGCSRPPAPRKVVKREMTESLGHVEHPQKRDARSCCPPLWLFVYEDGTRRRSALVISVGVKRRAGAGVVGAASSLISSGVRAEPVARSKRSGDGGRRTRSPPPEPDDAAPSGQEQGELVARVTSGRCPVLRSRRGWRGSRLRRQEVPSWCCRQ